MPPDFDEYVANLGQYSRDRRSYIENSVSLGKMLAGTQSCDMIVKRTLALRLPATIFLFFHVGTYTSTMVLVDMSAGSATPFPTSFGKNQFRSIHQEYQEAAQNSASQESALDRLLSRYATLFGPLLEPILPFLTAKHLKIFPRLQMNAVPFHALRLHGKYLLEHCAHQLLLHEPGDRVEVNLVR